MLNINFLLREMKVIWNCGANIWSALPTGIMSRFSYNRHNYKESICAEQIQQSIKSQWKRHTWKNLRGKPLFSSFSRWWQYEWNVAKNERRNFWQAKNEEIRCGIRWARMHVCVGTHTYTYIYTIHIHTYIVYPGIVPILSFFLFITSSVSFSCNVLN